MKNKTKTSKELRKLNEQNKELEKAIDLQKKINKERYKQPEPIEINLKTIVDMMTLMKPLLESSLSIPKKIVPNVGKTSLMFEEKMQPHKLIIPTLIKEVDKVLEECKHNWHLVGFSTDDEVEFVCDKCGKIKSILVE